MSPSRAILMSSVIASLLCYNLLLLPSAIMASAIHFVVSLSFMTSTAICINFSVRHHNFNREQVGMSSFGSIANNTALIGY